MEPVYTIKEVAERYGVSTKTIFRRIKAGELTVIHVGRKTLIRQADLVDFEIEMRSK